jgi:hypothetical protein
MMRARIYAMTLGKEARKLGTVDGEYQDDKLGDTTPKLN